MSRVIKRAEVRRDEILDAAEALFAERGYGDTSIQAIIDAVGISKGAFYHHFRSKSDLLDGLVARLREAGTRLLEPLVEDTDLTAIEKLQQFFGGAEAWKRERRSLIVDIGRALNDEANAPLLLRHRRVTFEVSVPLLGSIIRQGVEEGVFETSTPEISARIVLHVVAAWGDAFGEAVLGDGSAPPSLEALEDLHDAHATAVERVLGAPPGSIRLIERRALRTWMDAFTPALSGANP